MPPLDDITCSVLSQMRIYFVNTYLHRMNSLLKWNTRHFKFKQTILKYETQLNLSAIECNEYPTYHSKIKAEILSKMSYFCLLYPLDNSLKQFLWLEVIYWINLNCNKLKLEWNSQRKLQFWFGCMTYFFYWSFLKWHRHCWHNHHGNKR